MKSQGMIISENSLSSEILFSSSAYTWIGATENATARYRGQSRHKQLPGAGTLTENIIIRY